MTTPVSAGGSQGVGNYPNVEIELKNNRYWDLGQLDENLEEVHEIAEIKEDVVLGCNNSSVTKFVNRTSGKINMKAEKNPGSLKELKPVVKVQN